LLRSEKLVAVVPRRDDRETITMQFERDTWRRFGRSGRSNVLAHAERIELLDAIALRNEASTAGLAVHQAEERDRALRMTEHAFMLRELARRTGDVTSLIAASRAAERAIRAAGDDEIRITARLELAASSLLAAELFGDSVAAGAAEVRIVDLESQESLSAEHRIIVRGYRARLLGREALANNDLNAAVEAAGLYDEAVEQADACVRQSGRGRTLAASLRLHRSELLVGFGMQLKECSLLRQAQTDLGQVATRIDRDRLPITWARAEALRGAALAASGMLEGQPDEMSQGAAALSAALAHLPNDHSPLDTARSLHAMGMALMALAEACEDDQLFDEAVDALDRAMFLFDEAPDVANRPICAFDRAIAITRRAERRGDLKSLDYAEATFRAELMSVKPSTQPLDWAVLQVALARVYEARADVTGEVAELVNAAVSLHAAFDVFTERGLRTLSEIVLSSLEQIKSKS
jgi:tetratricopeptide (TPR) repeat protein